MAAKKSVVPEADTPEGILAAADAEIVEADALAAALEAAARAGDENVTPEQLAAADTRGRWARIRRDAATHRAAARAQELAEQFYQDTVAKNLPLAQDDHTAEITALLEQARPFLAQAIELLGSRNKAVWMLAKYASDLENHREADDGLIGTAFPQMPGASWFEYQGKRYVYRPASDVFKELLKPLVDRANVLSGGNGARWLSEI